jgi:hypothetical protein
MRRAPSVLLVFVFSFSLIAPALPVDADSGLPACCRRDGAHHCAMVEMDQAADARVSVTALKTKCPWFPKSGLVLPQGGWALAASVRTRVFWAASPAPEAPSQTAARGTALRVSHLRGPPSLLSR